MRILFPAGVLLLAAWPSIAAEVDGAKKVIVEEKTVVCIAEGKGEPNCKVMQGGPGGPAVDAEVMQDGGKVDRKVVVIRRSMLDDADSDRDGVVSKAEFLAQAEKHFAEMDRDKNGSLSKDEAMPPMPAVMMMEDGGPHVPHH